jgi:hypothetical protein
MLISQLYVGICRTSEKRHGVAHSGLPTGVKTLVVASSWQPFNGQPRLPC